MGRLWCRDLPVVTPPEGDRPTAVTVVLPYYENPSFLRRQAASWAAWPAEVRAVVSMIVVDDGSPVPAVHPGGDRVRLLEGPGYVDWDGRGEGGVVCGSGVYFLHVEANGATEIRRVAILRGSGP